MPDIDLAQSSLRELNQAMHRQSDGTNESSWKVLNPHGAHAVVVGVDAPIDVTIMGSVGYYCAGMNKKATITVHGSAGPGVAENMMSGKVIVKGDASQYAGATGRGACSSSRATPRLAAAFR
jgi:glutamate synthase domain-containing protein 3